MWIAADGGKRGVADPFKPVISVFKIDFERWTILIALRPDVPLIGATPLKTVMVGKNLSHYLIEAELGRGGMGIVYRAKDTKLDRTVAIKVLPSAALASEDDRIRFYREAKAAAQLHNPNIASIFEIDEAVPSDAPHGTQPSPFIAMEFIEGETLHDRIAKGPVKLEEAVRIAREVASALEAAHEKSIVHRDIKAANVMLTSKGVAKVLDFGLAQTAQSTKLTRLGSTLGTVAYMSPEQARGEEVDRRTDIWSLGAVLYEMISGRLPFGGEYEQAVVFSILNSDPEPLTSLRTGVPMELERIVNKALSKRSDVRYQSAADIIADLKALELGSITQSHVSGQLSRTTLSASPMHSGTESAAPRPANSKRSTLIVAASAVLIFLLGWFASRLTAPKGDADIRVEKLTLDMENMRRISGVAMSPDKEYIAIVGYDWDGIRGLFLFNVETGTLSHIPRSENAYYPFFSPSGSRLAFSTEESEGYVVDVPLGTPRKILDDSWTTYWMDDDRILYSRRVPENLSTDRPGRANKGGNFVYSISRDSSSIVQGTELAGEGAIWYFPGPRVPGSNFAIGNQQGQASFGVDPLLYTIDLSNLTMRMTDYSLINPQPISNDILVYQLGDDAGKLVARRFDAETATFTSAPEDVLANTFFTRFYADPGGDLLYSPDDIPNKQLVSVLDVSGRSLDVYDLSGEPGQLDQITVNPSASTLLLSMFSGETGLTRFLSIDLDSGAMITRADEQTASAEYLDEDGTLFTSGYTAENGNVLFERVLIRRSISGAGQIDTLAAPVEGLSYGGRIEGGYVIGTASDVGIVEEPGKSYRKLAESDGYGPALSPDKRYIAFVGRGGQPVIYDFKTEKVSELATLKATSPQWSPDGRYLYMIEMSNILGVGRASSVYTEAHIVRVPVNLKNGFVATGDPEFVAHVNYPIRLQVGENRVIVASNGSVSLNRPERKSARIVWWRNLARQLDAKLSK